MKYFLLIITIAMFNISKAQKGADISGIYSFGPSSPEGGAHLFVLENGKYAIAYFGGIQTGHWKLIQGDTYMFVPNVKQNKFEIYGRHNKDFKDSSRFFFNGFEEGKTFINLGAKENGKYVMRRVFNVNANCFSYPYVHVFESLADSISFMFLEDGTNKSSPVITFNNQQGYNDFAVYFYKQDSETRPFSAKFKDGKLYFEGQYSEQSPLPEEGEDIDFIRAFLDKDANPDKVFYNPFYNKFDGDINAAYVFNEQKGAYLASYYVEGEEYKESDNSYDRMSIIYLFKLMEDFTGNPVEFKIDENPLFQVSCD